MAEKIHPCPQFVGAQIRFWRKKVSLTQSALSNTSGVKLRHLQNIEAGRVDMKLHTLGAISLGLGVHPHILLTPVIENRAALCRRCLNILPRR